MTKTIYTIHLEYYVEDVINTGTLCFELFSAFNKALSAVSDDFFDNPDTNIANYSYSMDGLLDINTGMDAIKEILN